MSKYGTSERKYYVKCLRVENHEGNQWRYHDEDRPDRCAQCGGPVDATLIEADGERMITDPDEFAADLERQGNELSERLEQEAEERHAGEPDDDMEGREVFADPSGNSALRAATKSNPRNLPCPTCGAKNRLTPADQARGYQCDQCADRDERGGY